MHSLPPPCAFTLPNNQWVICSPPNQLCNTPVILPAMSHTLPSPSFPYFILEAQVSQAQVSMAGELRWLAGFGITGEHFTALLISYQRCDCVNEKGGSSIGIICVSASLVSTTINGSHLLSLRWQHGHWDVWTSDGHANTLSQCMDRMKLVNSVHFSILLPHDIFHRLIG